MIQYHSAFSFEDGRVVTVKALACNMPLSNHELVNAEINEGAYRTLFLLVDRVKRIKSTPNPKNDVIALLRNIATRTVAFLSYVGHRSSGSCSPSSCRQHSPIEFQSVDI